MAATDIIVIGGGAAGLIAAGRAAESGGSVILLEKMPATGNKLRLTGNGRCNLSNNKPLQEFVAMFGPNGRFLYGVFHQFFRDELLALLARYGISTKVETDGHIFPVSDDARDVYQALHRYLEQGKVRIITGEKVTEILSNGREITGVRAGERVYPGEVVIMATGGASYPGTGSSGDGYRLAAALGHTVVKVRPASVPLTIKDVDLAQKLQGLSLPDIRLTFYAAAAKDAENLKTINTDYGRVMQGKKPPPPVIESRRGSLLFTHFGISGPVVLPMSLGVVDALANHEVSAGIDLIPDLDSDELKQEMQREMDLNGKRRFRNTLHQWLPEKMVTMILEMSKAEGDIPNHQVDAAVRDRVAGLLKACRFDIQSALPIDAAMVTAGGVALDEIEPKTMASKLIKGLYFCGEVIDIDAETGGNNLQAAFSTGYIAGERAAKYMDENSKS